MLTVKKHALLALAALVFMSALSAGCGRKTEPPAPASLTPITPAPGETPSASLQKKEDAPRVRVKRDKDDEYSWEIQGKDVRAIIEVDRRLRREYRPKDKTGSE